MQFILTAYRGRTDMLRALFGSSEKDKGEPEWQGPGGSVTDLLSSLNQKR